MEREHRVASTKLRGGDQPVNSGCTATAPLALRWTR